MPLLHKKAFKRSNPPTLQPEDKVFYCELTNEVFTDYDEFWERLVLCNAMVWTCEMTGRNSLTFEEAVESEEKARKCLSKISPALHKPLLYLTSLTKRGKYSDMNDDVFNYVRDRYFVSEPVEAIVKNHWYDCKVVKVIMPTIEEVAKYELEMEDSDNEDEEEEKPVENGTAGNDDDSDIVILDDPKPTTPPKVKKDKSDPKIIAEKIKEINTESEDYPPYATICYEVEELEPWDYKATQRHIVKWEQIRRTKSALTREKAKLYLKQCVEIDKQGFWTLKAIYRKKYKIDEMSFSDIFVGVCPKFVHSKAKKAVDPDAAMKKKKEKKELKEREKKEKERDKDKKEDKVKGRPPLTEEEKQAKIKERNERMEKVREEIKLRQEKEKLEKKRDKDMKKEEKRITDYLMKEWTKPREDLDCDDHKTLPVATPIQCRIPNELFGEFMMVLEFLTAFTETIELKDVYSHGVNFDMLEHALVENEVAGLYNDVLQLLLGAIFNLQEQEDDEVKDATAVGAESTDEKECKDPVKLEAMRTANRAARWSQRFQGASLQKVPLDALTLTEVLRLHLLASGATSVANAVWRHQYRGGFKVWDDPGMHLKLEHPHLVETLAKVPVFELEIGDKLTILSVLMNQILTYANVRDIIDEGLEQVREIKNELKLHKAAEVKHDREQTAAQKLKLKEEKQRKIDTVLKNMEKKAEGATTEELQAEEEEQRQIEEKNREKKKQELIRKEQELLEKLQQLSKNVSLYPLGTDRAYRRYWVFENFDGLFVEDNEIYPGTCRDEPTKKLGTTGNPLDSKVLQEKIKKLAQQNIEEAYKIEKEEKSNSDKENEGSQSPTKPVKNNQNLLKPANNATDSQIQNAENNIKTKEPETKPVALKLQDTVPDIDLDQYLDSAPETNEDIFGLCNAEPKNCYVHNEDTIKARTKWLFYHASEDLDQLIASLNTRGIRESQLKETLINNKTQLETSITRCPAYKLDPTQDPETDKSLRKSQRGQGPNKKDGDSNLNFPLGTPVNEIFESTIRDLILEMEEKINMGFLGSLKVPDVEVWRSSVSEGLSVGDFKDVDYAGNKRLKKLKDKLGVESDDGSELEDFRNKDEITGNKIEGRDSKTVDLAIAILQMAQSVDAKYFKVPLGESEKQATKRKRAENKLAKLYKKDQENSDSDSDSDEDEKDQKNKKTITNDLLRTPLELWEKSLMASTSLSQLFLHLATLDNSITWSRSAMNARCRICRKKSDPDNMLLCDGCDKGHHMYCLKPKLKNVPDGDWFCDSCKPKEKPKSPQKKRKIYVEESEEEESEDEEEDTSCEEGEECEICNKGGTQLECCNCNRCYHLDCADVRKLPRTTWTCAMCRINSQSKPTKGSKGSPTDKKKKTSANNNQKRKRKSAVEEERPSKRQKQEQEEEKPSKKQKQQDHHEEGSRSTRRSLGDVSVLNAGAQETILQELSGHKSGWPFLKRVNKKDVPDYYTIVKKPMDFRTIHNKMQAMKYTTDAEYIADVLLVFQNCQQYNLENTDEYKCAVQLTKVFRKRVKELGLFAADLMTNGVDS